uniref:Uncharacterized protein n=1 Tax=Glossina pallidipes TaxID=7398 RepID=A0A1B0A5C2_GLOPL
MDRFSSEGNIEQRFSYLSHAASYLFFTPHTHFSAKEFQLIAVYMVNKIAYINDKLEKEEKWTYREKRPYTIKASERIDQWTDNCNREANAGTAMLTLTISPLNASTEI